MIEHQRYGRDTTRGLFKAFFGIALLIVLAWLAFWATVVGIGVFLLFKYLL